MNLSKNTNCDSELKFKLFVKNKNRNILSRKIEHSRTGTIILQDNDDWKEDLNSKKSNKPKSKALCISNDNNADKDEMDKADLITKLCQKWEYKICNKICCVDGDCYLELTLYQLQIWAKDIVIDSNNTLLYGMSYAPQPQIIYYPALVHSTNSYKLEVINNESGSYTQFERAFENEKNSLDTIKELSESDLIEFGANKMGWHKKL
ncbi:29924_t:CDS:2 [Gigaspora margarita]|uniref:29924_t:CDS:1 n=1 Tax=Gigaspora margarita TaxID=4874 RepID=A0ABN7UF22_GIGMA|nr:29924_t:CDS:2 [Gigaspora margarita]